MKSRGLLNWQEHQFAESSEKHYKTLSPAAIITFKRSQKSVCFSSFQRYPSFVNRILGCKDIDDLSVRAPE
ncbi:hypothetical protein JG687_00019594 [Phytophthora cactorum]|uniref:Uncharacterized protein n=1 Tax=Phytophthora cactorum TaxID=29920 RepID=A0A8T1TL95_9STRA|nr:hypothetical protein JG687_00019594 [Phytophthora cactorum]